MEWFVRGLFGAQDRLDILPGLYMQVWRYGVETTSGMWFVQDRFRIVCEWFPF